MDPAGHWRIRLELPRPRSGAIPTCRGMRRILGRVGLAGPGTRLCAPFLIPWPGNRWVSTGPTTDDDRSLDWPFLLFGERDTPFPQGGCFRRRSLSAEHSVKRSGNDPETIRLVAFQEALAYRAGWRSASPGKGGYYGGSLNEVGPSTAPARSPRWRRALPALAGQLILSTVLCAGSAEA